MYNHHASNTANFTVENLLIIKMGISITIKNADGTIWKSKCGADTNKSALLACLTNKYLTDAGKAIIERLINETIIANIIIIANGIQSGLNTHHQLQSMLWVSFNTRNTMNNIVPNPIPSDVLSFAMFICFLIR